MVVSQNKGTPIWTPKYYSPYYGDPQNGTPNFGKPPYLKRSVYQELRQALREIAMIAVPVYATPSLKSGWFESRDSGVGFGT